MHNSKTIYLGHIFMQGGCLSIAAKIIQIQIESPDFFLYLFTNNLYVLHTEGNSTEDYIQKARNGSQFKPSFKL